MDLDKKQVEKLANLAKLELSPAELGQYAQQLDSILDYVEKINKLDLGEIKQSLRGTEEAEVGPRPDQVSDTGLDPKDQACQSQGDYVVASAVFKK